VAQGDGTHGTGEIAGLDQIATLERPAEGEEKTGQKIFADLAEGETQNDGHDAAGGHQTRGDALQAQHAEGEHQPRAGAEENHQRAQQLLVDTLPAAAAQQPLGQTAEIAAG